MYNISRPANRVRDVSTEGFPNVVRPRASPVDARNNNICGLFWLYKGASSKGTAFCPDFPDGLQAKTKMLRHAVQDMPLTRTQYIRVAETSSSPSTRVVSAELG
jgi:hypothetical protein